MSAIGCGKRPLFEEALNPTSQKRLRCGAGGFPAACPAALRADSSSPFSQLKGLFPDLDDQLIERVLMVSGGNLEYATRSLCELQFIYDGSNSSHVPNDTNLSEKVLKGSESQQVGVQSYTASANHQAVLSVERTKWVDLFVEQMLSTSNLDDAEQRATKALEAFEKATISQSGSSFVSFQKENDSLKDQVQYLVRENHILKRAVAIQHERQVLEKSSQELQQMKQLMVQSQEQIRTLEMNNYALNLQLWKGRNRPSMPGHFHPDVF